MNLARVAAVPFVTLAVAAPAAAQLGGSGPPTPPSPQPYGTVPPLSKSAPARLTTPTPTTPTPTNPTPTTPTPTTPTTPAATTSAATTPMPAGLPRTGADLLPEALLGGALLVSGAAVRLGRSGGRG